jgi:hypothetical protein
MADTFGTPESSQQEVQSNGGSRTTLILLILVIGGGAVLGYLLYRQNQEPAPVLEEVSQTIETPATTPAANPAAGISEPDPEATNPTVNIPGGLPTSAQ